ncbi:hypothetical protein ACFX2A_032551 [Malus domestica]
MRRGSKQASLLLPQPPVAAAAKQEEKKPQLVDMEATFAQCRFLPGTIMFFMLLTSDISFWYGGYFLIGLIVAMAFKSYQ